MASLRDQFHQYYAPDEDAIATAIQTGLVTPDTNVLLNLYRFQRGAREELLSLLEKVGDRLWIPHQVGLEFHRNRLTVMSGQEGYFAETLKDLNGSIDALRGKVRAFRARIALDEDNVQEIEDNIAQLRDLIGDAVIKAQESNEVRLDNHASDEVLARITALFENRVGEPMSPDELTAAREEAQRRVREQVPPGYKDKGKADSTGDYLVWKQLMLEAKNRKVPVVLVTDDRKEDWYQEFNGRTLGPRRELREEMMAEAGVPLLIMTTETFLLQAGKYLNVEVSPETVDQAKELSTVGRFILPPPNAALSRVILDTLSDRDPAELRASLSPAERDFLLRPLAFKTEKGSPEDDQARREAFEEFLQVLPTDREIERHVAAKFIVDFLISDQATEEDATRAVAWARRYAAQPKDSPGEPPPGGLDAQTYRGLN